MPGQDGRCRSRAAFSVRHSEMAHLRIRSLIIRSLDRAMKNLRHGASIPHLNAPFRRDCCPGADRARMNAPSELVARLRDSTLIASPGRLLWRRFLTWIGLRNGREGKKPPEMLPIRQILSRLELVRYCRSIWRKDEEARGRRRVRILLSMSERPFCW